MKLKIAVLLVVVVMLVGSGWCSEDSDEAPSPRQLLKDTLEGDAGPDLRHDATIWRWWRPWRLWKWVTVVPRFPGQTSDQRTLTRHDSDSEFLTDVCDAGTMTSIGGDSASQPLSECEYNNLSRVKVPVRHEIVTLLFDSMLEHIVDSWDVIPSKREEFSLYLDKDMSSKKTIVKKSRSLKNKRSMGNKDTVQTDNVQTMQPDPTALWFPSIEERAIIKFRNGNMYEGSLFLKRMHGQGRFQWADGTIYMGEFKDNAITGRGTLYWKEDMWYEGEFLGNIRHGQGLFVNSRTQLSYIGGWYCGMKHGQGVIQYSSHFDNSYDGQWVYNVREGTGTREYGAASGYTGEWEYYTREGKGSMIWPNHDVYIGSWKNGKMSGNGTYIWDNYDNNSMSRPALNAFQGRWENGERNGYGVLKLGVWMGSCYKGEFKNNKKHGPGQLITNNGLIIDDQKLFKDDIMTSTSLERHWAGYNKSKDVETVNDSTVGVIDHIKWALANINTLSQRESNAKILEEYIKNNKDLPEQHGEDYEASIQSTATTAGEPIDLPEWIEFEDLSLKSSLRCYESKLKNIYFTYAKICNKEEINFTPLLIRLYLWQFYYDCNIHEKGITLVEIDRIFEEHPQWCAKNPHDPFERVYYWQFLHSLISVASRLYCEKYMPVTKPDTLISTAFIKFMEIDVIPNTGRRKGAMVNGYGRCIPLKPLYRLYRRIGEPHTIRQFVCAVRRPPHSVLPEPSLVEAPDGHLPIGSNAYLLGNELLFIPDEPSKRHGKEDKTEDFKDTSDLNLFNFGNLSSKTIIKIFANIFPGVLKSDKIINIETQIVFFEFFEAFIACAKESIRVKDREILLKEFAEARLLQTSKQYQGYVAASDYLFRKLAK